MKIKRILLADDNQYDIGLTVLALSEFSCLKNTTMATTGG